MRSLLGEGLLLLFLRYCSEFECDSDVIYDVTNKWVQSLFFAMSQTQYITIASGTEPLQTFTSEDVVCWVFVNNISSTVVTICCLSQASLRCGQVIPVRVPITTNLGYSGAFWSKVWESHIREAIWCKLHMFYWIVSLNTLWNNSLQLRKLHSTELLLTHCFQTILTDTDVLSFTGIDNVAFNSTVACGRIITWGTVFKAI